MNTVRDFIDKLTAIGLPAWALGAGGILLLLIAMKFAKGFLKFVFGVLALAALAGAVWWHFHKQGRI